MIGVYLTTVPPSAGKKAIVETCWGPQFYPRLVHEGRVNYVFRIWVPHDQVERARGTKREVYLHLGDLVLNDHGWDDLKVPDEDGCNVL